MPSHKTLKSVVRGLAESFTGLMNCTGDDYVMGYAVLAAWQTGATEFRVDLLTGSATHAVPLAPEVAKSLAGYVADFPRLVRSSNSDIAFVASADLVVTIDPASRRQVLSRFFESPFACTVSITDDRGKLYAHTVSGWWWPESSRAVDYGIRITGGS
jgi:hypothetical protein